MDEIRSLENNLLRTKAEAQENIIGYQKEIITKYARINTELVQKTIQLNNKLKNLLQNVDEKAEEADTSKTRLTISIDIEKYGKLVRFSQENEETIAETIEKLIDTL